MATMSSGSGVEKKIRLKCSDGEILEVEETVALESNMIKKKMEKAGHADEVIELENVSSVVLSNVMDCCRKYAEARRENKEDEIKQFRTDFLQRWLMKKDGDLLSVSKYLEIMSLVELIDQQFELVWNAKSIREILHEDQWPSVRLRRLRYDRFDRTNNWESMYGEIMHLWDNQPIGQDEIEMSLEIMRLWDDQDEIEMALNHGLRLLYGSRYYESTHCDLRLESKYGEIMRSWDDQPIGPDEIEMSLDNSDLGPLINHLPRQSPVYRDPFWEAKDHEQTSPLLADQNVGASTNGNLMHENVDEVSTNKTDKKEEIRLRHFIDTVAAQREQEREREQEEERKQKAISDLLAGSKLSGVQINNREGLRHRPVRASSSGDHQETNELLTDENVDGVSNDGLLTDENVDEVSAYNRINLEKMFVIINFVLELPSAVFDQLSSVHKPQYAIMSMSLSFVTMFLCIVELVHKCRKEEVTWKWRSILPWLYYPPRNYSKPFGNFKDIIGLISAICQCIFATITFYFARRHADNPVKISFWPIVFALGLLCSKFLEKPPVIRRRRQLERRE